MKQLGLKDMSQYPAKFYRRWATFIEYLKTIGFEFDRELKHGFRFKNKVRNCFIQLPDTFGDREAAQNWKSQIRKVLTAQCSPPFKPEEFRDLRTLRLMDWHTSHYEIGIDNEEKSMESLNKILDDAFEFAKDFEEVRVTVNIQPKYKSRLKDIASKKGTTLGQVLEDMIDKFNKSQ